MGVTWKFTGDCTIDTEIRWEGFDRAFRSVPAFLDLIANTAGKHRFEPTDFFLMLERFRRATDSYGEY